MGGATERAQALLDPLSANSDCASAFKDEKEEGGRESRRGRHGMGWNKEWKDKASPSVHEACVHHQPRGNNADHA